MAQTTPFPELLSGLRAGDRAAIGEFVSAYEPFIRRTIRLRLVRTSLQAAADSADVCQSVLGTVLIRLAAGEYELDSRQDLEKLLFAITRKKFAAMARHESADRRDRRRTRSLGSSEDFAGDSGMEPSRMIDARDLLDEVQRRLTDEERPLFRLRQHGHSWDSIVERVGGSAALLRKRLSRALKRIAAEMGLEDHDG